MKKFMTDIKTLAALLMAGAAFTACSSDDNIIEQPQNPIEPKVYTLVIKASKGDDATTRALKPGTDDETGKNTVDAYWSGTETIEVGQAGEIIGTANAAPSADGNTTITATLTKAPTTTSDIVFYLCGGNLDYTGQVGLLTDDVNKKGISEKYDYAWALLYTGNFEVNGYNVNVTNDTYVLDFVNDDGYGFKGNVGQAIVKFTLVDKGNSDAPINATSLTIHDSKGYLIQSDNKIGWGGPTFGDVTISPAGTTNVIYAALAGVSGSNLTLTATDGTDTYTYSKSNVTFNRGQYYEITVKMNRVVDLSKTSIYKSNVFTAQNGDVLTGTVPEGKAVYVASGAEVTLRNATIDCDWTYALFCWGNNTINLEGTNTARSIDKNNTYDGINCYNGALTIQGSGSLTATGCNGGAGITCFDTGSITIKGGTITATGSYYEYGPFGGAGIGGVSSCGDIIIEGGTIEATGGNYAAGIGGGLSATGDMSSCGNITIKSTVTSVTATRGYGAPNSIGAGYNGTCGTVTIEYGANVTQ